MKATLLALTILISINVNADEYLLKEMIDLKESIQKTDPEYGELTRRLADVYFDLSIQEGGTDEYRKNSLMYYNEHINGSRYIKAIEGEKRINMLFQTARLNEKLGRLKKAASIYHEVFDNSDFDTDLKRQTALHLAEYYENEAIYSKATPFYDISIKLCSSVAVCNYAHYRKAWLLYKDVKLDEAIEELKLSLWHQDGSIREKVLNDYFLFSSQRVTEGQDELAYVKELVLKTGNKKLVRTLVESFYSAGNRIAGSNVLEYMNSLKPDLYYELRLLEEYYGFRNFEKVNTYLNAISLRNSADIPISKEEAKIAQTTIRRFIVQIDAESQRDQQYNPMLIKSIMTYLNLYPNDELREKMQQGWLKAQVDKREKLSQLAIWIKEDIALGKKDEWIKKMRTSRLSLAQKMEEKAKKDNKELDLSSIVLEESLALSQIATEEAEIRQYKYVYAYRHYTNKKYDSALPLFKEISKIVDGGVDKYSILSQNLILDIHNKNKNYSEIVAETDNWLSGLANTKDKKIKGELASMNQIQNQARFEYAAGLGEKVEALDIFYGFCFKGIFEKKSCTNAKVLSEKLKDQTKFVSLLEKEKDTDALIVEYELMGEYSKTAAILERRLNANSTIQEYFKVSLLYELDMNLAKRDKILKKIISKVKRAKKINKEHEALLWVTMDEANMLTSAALTMPWSMNKKIVLAKRLELNGSDKKAQKIIFAQKTSTGPIWSRNVLSKVVALDKKQAKIKFYGRSSKWLFKKRTRALNKLKTKTLSYLEGADSETRIYMIDILENAYAKMEDDIMKTPLPEGLTEDILAQVKLKLTEMATPFKTVKEDYARLKIQEKATLTEKAKITEIDTNLALESKDYVSFIKLPEAQKAGFKTASLDSNEIMQLKSDLKTSPMNAQILKKLENHYKVNNSQRLASYYTGRLNNLGEVK